MHWQHLLYPFAWLINGLLVVVYTLFEHWQTTAIIPPLVWLAGSGPRAHHTWGIVFACTAVLASALVPSPVPFLLLALTLAGGAILGLERFNPDDMHWRVFSTIAAYSLVGMGLSAFQWYLENQAGGNLTIAQSQPYLAVFFTMALYGFPLGAIALLGQGLFVHPPLPGKGSPAAMIHELRSKRRD